MSPLVTSFAPCARPAALAGRYELDRAGLNLEQRGKETNVLAVHVDAYLLRRCHRDPLTVHELNFGIGVVQVLAVEEVVDATRGLDLARILDQDHVEHAVGWRSRRSHLHAAAEKLTVGDDDLLSLLQLMRGSID